MKKKQQVARKAGRAPRRAERDKPHEEKMQPAPRRGVKLTAPVNWKVLPRTVYALADSACRGTNFETFRQLVVGITEPLRILESLTTLAERALAGNPFAETEFRATVAGLAAKMAAPDGKLPAGSDSGAPLNHAGGSRCGCDDRRVEMAAFGSPPRDATLLDEKGLSDLLIATARFHFRCDLSARERALATVMNVIGGAGLIAELADAERSGGAAVSARLAQLAALGALVWAARPMHTMMGTMPEMPQLPDLPSIGGKFPSLGGGLDFAFPKPALDELLTWLRKRKQWDPELWDPPYRFWHESYHYVDWRNWPYFRCVSEVFNRIRARSKLEPPPRPLRVTWADGISRITTTGACAGDKVVIRGTGLQMPDAVLLVPFEDGCHVIAVPVANWVDTSITFTLPPGAISGPIGFGDANYIAAYDTWAAEQNRLATEIEAIWCLNPMLPWVPPFRECPPDVGVNRIRAGFPVIDAFTANGETLLVLDSGGLVTLDWAVRNADDLFIVSTSTTPGGTVLPGTTVANPPGSSLPLGDIASLNPIAITYRLAAGGPCKSAKVFREVTIVLSKRPELYFDNFEVTQGIQTIPPTVRLVARKPTVVRAMLRHKLDGHSGDVVPKVTGRICVRRQGGGTSQWWDAANGSNPMAATPGASITVNWKPLRMFTDDTLNFLIPPEWCTDGARFEIEARVVGFGAVGAFPGYDEAVTFLSAPYTFLTRPTLELRYNPVLWNADPSSVPTPKECDDAIRLALPRLPTPGANILPLNFGTQSGSGNAGPDGLVAGTQPFLDMWDFVHDMLPESAIWVFLTKANIGGRGTRPGKTLVSSTVPATIAHELGHNFNQVHVNVCGATGGEEAFPLWGAGGSARIVDIVFDSVSNVAIYNAQDLMGYCDPGWPAPLRWDRLWDNMWGTP